jgi:hypothetical protein
VHLPERNFKHNDTHGLKAKARSLYHTDTGQREAGVAMFISEWISQQSARYKDTHFIMTNWFINQEDIKILGAFTSRNNASKLKI